MTPLHLVVAATDTTTSCGAGWLDVLLLLMLVSAVLGIVVLAWHDLR